MGRLPHQLVSPLPFSLQEFLAYFNTNTEAETAVAERSPNSLMYTSWLLASVHERAFYEGK